MDSFEYALGLFSLLIGLALADVANSFHRLMRHGRALKHDGRVFLSALFAALLAVGLWFDLWAVREVTETRAYVHYVWSVAELFLLFMLSAACLPEDPGPDCDLSTFYEGNRRYFWTLVLLFQLSYGSHYFYYVGLTEARLLRDLPAVLGLPLLALLLRLNSSPKVHHGGLILMLAIIFFDRVVGAYAII